MEEIADEVEGGEEPLYEPVDLAADEIEGTKDFNKAYDKLVKKFYNEDGANLMIPEEDMLIHEFQQ